MSKPEVLFAAYQDVSVFKLFLHDIGLLGGIAELNVRTIIEGR